MKKNRRVIFYHRTNAENAREIVESGFTNSSGYFLSNRIWTGVWLSSVPVDGEGAGDDAALLMVKLNLKDSELSKWEWASEGRPYREWLIPAGIVNKCATVEMIDQLDTSFVAA
jgi:hypothetical protein